MADTGQPEPTDIISLDALKAWLDIRAENTRDDTVLQRLISAVSAKVYTRCGRPANGFTVSADITETRNGTGTTEMVFANWPVTSVASLTVDGISITPSPDGVQPGYVFDDQSISLVGIPARWNVGQTFSGLGFPHYFRQGKNNVVVAYTAGYDSVPDDLIQDVIDICSLRYMGRQRIGLRSSQSRTGETTTFDTGEQEEKIMQEIERRYKRRFIIS